MEVKVLKRKKRRTYRYTMERASVRITTPPTIRNKKKRSN